LLLACLADLLAAKLVLVAGALQSLLKGLTESLLTCAHAAQLSLVVGVGLLTGEGLHLLVEDWIPPSSRASRVDSSSPAPTPAIADRAWTLPVRMRPAQRWRGVATLGRLAPGRESTLLPGVDRHVSLMFPSRPSAVPISPF
jgi:hypothetical protein